MRDFPKRRSFRAELTRVVLGSAGLLLLALLAWVMGRAAWGMYGKFTHASEARQSTEAELSSLQEQLAQVEGAVADFNSERGLEAQVRERFGVARPGEGEITIVRRSREDETAAPLRGFWQRIWDAVFVW